MHGGNIYSNKIEHDFSVNVNPFYIPESIKTALHDAVDICNNYPDIQYHELKNAISKMTNVRTENILCGNGSSELFPAIVRAVSAYKNKQDKCISALISVPSFSGYERACGAGNANVTYYEMKRENEFCLTEKFIRYITDETDIIFLANPNNPTGAAINPALLNEILSVCFKKHIIVVLDECYIDFLESGSKYSYINKIEAFPNLVVVRSFTKIFAIPGVRLGYLACSNTVLIEKIAYQLAEWNISSFAQQTGIAAAAETEYISKCSEYIKFEREYMTESLKKFGFTVFNSEANFILFYTHYPIAKMMLDKKILIRDCSDFHGLTNGYYRICAKQRAENDRLLEAIKDSICR